MAASQYNNFLGLDHSLSEISKARVGVISAPLELSTSFQTGTARGPAAIIAASQQVELYDIPSKTDFSTVGVHTFPSLSFEGCDGRTASELIAENVRRCLDQKLWPITLGGEHTISYGPVKALFERYSDLTILQIDAHADLREEYEGSPFSHACVMKRAFDLGVMPVSVGIRNYSADEARLIEEKKIPVFHDFEIKKHGLRSELISKKLSKNVYVTVDIDGFTPEECPGTGTPEPGGITWWHALELFSYVFRNHNVVGMDLNEVMPLPSSARTEFFAAKLIYKMIGMKFFPEKACTGF